jgi:hypothetical protein
VQMRGCPLQECRFVGGSPDVLTPRSAIEAAAMGAGGRLAPAHRKPPLQLFLAGLAERVVKLSLCTFCASFRRTHSFSFTGFVRRFQLEVSATGGVMRYRKWAGFAAAFLTAACTNPPRPQELVSAGAIMNSLMCGMVMVHQNKAAGSLLSGKKAVVNLELKIVSSENLGLSVGGSGAKVVGWQGVSLVPTFGTTYSQGWTVDTNTTLTFEFPNDPEQDSKVCTAREELDPFGFSRWLAETLIGISRVTDISGKGTPDRKLVYDANFGVNYGASGSVTVIPLVGLPVTPSGGYSRNDVQHLTVTIPAPAEKAAVVAPASTFFTQKLIIPIGSTPGISVRNMRRVPE